MIMLFEWDDAKEKINIEKHGVDFETAKEAFLDEHRIVKEDDLHSTATEQRYLCVGMADGGVMTVRFTIRNDSVRIIGAGYWRKGRKAYEKIPTEKRHSIH